MDNSDLELTPENGDILTPLIENNDLKQFKKLYSARHKRRLVNQKITSIKNKILKSGFHSEVRVSQNELNPNISTSLSNKDVALNTWDGLNGCIATSSLNYEDVVCSFR
ncbi:hypothetical protein RN001_002944 [Aquatica leii]|uniref:Uncharacterized protein n=1 Tax=Aquatica leii TaxID=1421715 RepID=A0AAN7PHX4_9COLE|nr:hypothetical protein RN001_002944 [Aquatica leii]